MRIETIESTGGYKIRYNINGSGNSRGSGMADTRLTGGSGNYQTRKVGKTITERKSFLTEHQQQLTLIF